MTPEEWTIFLRTAVITGIVCFVLGFCAGIVVSIWEDEKERKNRCEKLLTIRHLLLKLKKK